MHVSFVNASSKVAPKMATSVPRLELNAAVEAAANAAFLRKELSRPPDRTFLFFDGMVVVGYIHNKEKKFVKYAEGVAEYYLVLGS